MARIFGSAISETAIFREPQIPGSRLERVNPPTVHRLDDELADTFNHACANNDLEAAADLLLLIGRWHSRRTYKDEQEKRVANVVLKRMYGELERRHIMRGTRAANSLQRARQNAT